MFKASLGAKAEEDQDESDWESVEEDFPVVELEELLDNLKIDEGENFEDDDAEETKGEEKKGM